MPGNRRGGGNCPTDDFFSAKPHNAGAAGVSGASRTDPHRTTEGGRGGVVCDAWDQYLGMEHTDTALYMAYTVNQRFQQ